MSAKAWLGAMVAASALVIGLGSRHRVEPLPPPDRPPPETPWLTRELAAQIIDGDGGPGPLFAGVVIGGSTPLPEVRARIAEFARANNVEIDLEIADDELESIRFEVLYGGCCGYEGADALAMRIGRPRKDVCCGCQREWIDDWANVTEDGVHVRVRVRVNRVELRWQRAISTQELVDRTDRLLGANAAEVARSAGASWVQNETGAASVLEIPFRFEGIPYGPGLGIELVVNYGRIAELSYTIRRDPEDSSPTIRALRSRLGRPRRLDNVFTWRKADRVVTAETGHSTTVVARLREFGE